MSFRLAADVLDFAPYSGGTLLVLLAMASWANDDGTRIYPSVRALSEKARLSIRQTQNALRELENDGTITVVTPGGGRKVTEYRIEVQKLHPRKNCTSATDDKHNVENCTPAVQSATAYIDTPSSEPINEPTNTTRAREVDAAQNRKQKPSEGFNRLWTEITNHWPGDYRANKAATERAWAILADVGELRPPGDMAAAARTEGRARQTAIDDASKRKGDRPKHVKSPSGWLLDRCFVGLIDEPEKSAAGPTAAPKAFDELVDVATAIITPDYIEALRRQGLADAEIAAWFADAEFVETGFILRAGTRNKAGEIAKRWGRQIGRIFGVEPELVDYQFRRERAA